MIDIVDELRNGRPGERQHHREARVILSGLLDEAAAEIAALRAENERLKEQAAAPWVDGYDTAAYEYRQLLIKTEDELTLRGLELHSAYRERNTLVALLATIYPSGVKRTAIEGWAPEWHNCVYIDFPWGQGSWHYHDSDRDLFEGIPPYQGEWDGHSTDEKYANIRNAIKENKNE